MLNVDGASKVMNYENDSGRRYRRSLNTISHIPDIPVCWEKRSHIGGEANTVLSEV